MTRQTAWFSILVFVSVIVIAIGFVQERSAMLKLWVRIYSTQQDIPQPAAFRRALISRVSIIQSVIDAASLTVRVRDGPSPRIGKYRCDTTKTPANAARLTGCRLDPSFPFGRRTPRAFSFHPQLFPVPSTSIRSSRRQTDASCDQALWSAVGLLDRARSDCLYIFPPPLERCQPVATLDEEHRFASAGSCRISDLAVAPAWRCTLGGIGGRVDQGGRPNPNFRNRL
jgi:hypothetical protein